ncbi:MAG: cyclic-di-AMP receptor [Anaerolineae bacterium]|nr:cyclic-di-AMP receptor [Anaerolineae bacterium]
MKMLLAVIQDVDADATIKALTDASFSVTRIGTTGGFFRQGNTTLLCGTDDHKVNQVLDILKSTCQTRTETVAFNVHPSHMMPVVREVEVGGATVFVFNVERFEHF